MPGIRTNAAAEVLGVSPNTLRSWERRYGFPEPKRTQGGHRNYELVELQTLRDALAQTGNISSAIELTRQRQAAPASGGGLRAALESFDEDAANRTVEESLALRPLERTVEELLLPAIDDLAADGDREAELEFASRWAMGWLHGARRLASPASRPAGILLLDSSHGSDAEAVHAQALDLTLRRAGFRVLMLSNELGDERLERALRALDPTAIVLCGPGADTAGAVKLVRKIREVGFDSPLFGFRASGLIGDAVPSAGVTPSEVTGMLNADLRRRAVQAFASQCTRLSPLGSTLVTSSDTAGRQRLAPCAAGSCRSSACDPGSRLPLAGSRSWRPLRRRRSSPTCSRSTGRAPT